MFDKASVRAAGALAAGSLAAEAEEAFALLAALRSARHATETRWQWARQHELPVYPRI